MKHLAIVLIIATIVSCNIIGTDDEEEKVLYPHDYIGAPPPVER
jgi:hypothetical protein